mmetsp:Transcript_28484/g.43523  ORF Transcript_28484/g.43523 Transcript_28484/m.43523 type:complete len:229 (+) Transcript_28484:65-751(+)
MMNYHRVFLITLLTHFFNLLLTSSAFLQTVRKCSVKLRKNKIECKESCDTPDRWRGSFQPGIRKLSDIPKAKKHSLELIVDGEKRIFEKKKYESLQHVFTKAILWKIFKEKYDNIQIEEDIGDPNYLPDAIALNATTKRPIFWGESGRMSISKAVELAARYPNTHICQIRWGLSLDDFVPEMAKAIRLVNREGKFSFGAIPNKNIWEYFDEENGTVHINEDDVSWHHL